MNDVVRDALKEPWTDRRACASACLTSSAERSTAESVRRSEGHARSTSPEPARLTRTRTQRERES
eukprot:6206884-Pleurochrysis_carterae.AAC.1